MILLLVFVAIILLGMVYIRVAPHNIKKVHCPPESGPVGDTELPGGMIHRRIVANAQAEELLQRLDKIIRATPRVSKLAGSYLEGQISYVARSKFWGFPDYITVSLSGGNSDYNETALTIYGRLRFGKSDFGVNKTRIELWLTKLDAAAL